MTLLLATALSRASNESFRRKNGEFVAYKRGVRLALTVSPKAADMLRAMLATGLWGRSQAEVAQRLIYQGLREPDTIRLIGGGR